MFFLRHYIGGFGLLLGSKCIQMHPKCIQKGAENGDKLGSTAKVKNISFCWQVLHLVEVTPLKSAHFQHIFRACFQILFRKGSRWSFLDLFCIFGGFWAHWRPPFFVHRRVKWDNIGQLDKNLILENQIFIKFEQLCCIRHACAQD